MRNWWRMKGRGKPFFLLFFNFLWVKNVLNQPTEAKLRQLKSAHSYHKWLRCQQASHFFSNIFLCTLLWQWEYVLSMYENMRVCSTVCIFHICSNVYKLLLRLLVEPLLIVGFPQISFPKTAFLHFFYVSFC